MKLKYIIILWFILLALPVYSIEECGRFQQVKDIPCNIITSYKPLNDCNTYSVIIYNQSGNNISTLSFGNYFPTCNFTFNYTKLQTYIWNSTIESGVITVEGDDENMIIILGAFLLLINLGLAYLPFKVKRFSISPAGDYVIKRMFWIAAILLLWFNMTLFRQLSSDWGLGVDNFLRAYWWIFTLAAFACVFIMCYVALVGALKLMKEARMKKRLGDEY